MREVEALARAVVTQFEQYVKLNKKVPPEVLVSLSQIDDPGKLADTVSAHLALKIADKQDLLETASLAGGWSVSTASWKARSASCRWKSASAAVSSGRWRRPSASTTSTSR
jgi:ATP-dependent Lon protease